MIDLTPVRDGTGPSRLLDMVEGRSKHVFKIWLEAQTPALRDGIEIVAMDGFTGFKTATAEEISDAVAVTDPFHVVTLAGDALDRCRQRVQQDTCGHRGRVGDPLYGIRRVLRTGVGCSPTANTPDSAAYSPPMSTLRSRRSWGTLPDGRLSGDRK
jgi:transposase